MACACEDCRGEGMCSMNRRNPGGGEAQQKLLRHLGQRRGRIEETCSDIDQCLDPLRQTGMSTYMRYCRVSLILLASSICGSAFSLIGVGMDRPTGAPDRVPLADGRRDEARDEAASSRAESSLNEEAEGQRDWWSRSGAELDPLQHILDARDLCSQRALLVGPGADADVCSRTSAGQRVPRG